MQFNVLDLLIKSIIIILVGMGVVFLFILIMVIFINIANLILRAFGLDKKEEIENVSGVINESKKKDDKKIAAIAGAIKLFENK